MSEAALKPCPFCGGAAEVEQHGTRKQSTIYACTECGGRLETGEVFNIGCLWNTRAPDPAVAALVSALEFISNRENWSQHTPGGVRNHSLAVLLHQERACMQKTAAAALATYKETTDGQ